ncbi:MAG: HAMP domain-containing sensor histidine kinase [Myxococcota bacterium]|nr:HAMP domain-containing sensor histidine kinase [Myxococcota bacterium]
MSWLTSTFRAYVNSFKTQEAIDACSPSSVAIAVGIISGFSLVARYVPSIHETIQLTSAFWPILLVSMAGTSSLICWLLLPERKSVAALFQPFENSLYCSSVIAIGVQSNEPTEYVCSLFCMVACWYYGHWYALTLLGTLSVSAGPIIVGLVFGARPINWCIIGVCIGMYIYFADRTRKKRIQEIVQTNSPKEVMSKAETIISAVPAVPSESRDRVRKWLNDQVDMLFGSLRAAPLLPKAFLIPLFVFLIGASILFLPLPGLGHVQEPLRLRPSLVPVSAALVCWLCFQGFLLRKARFAALARVSRFAGWVLFSTFIVILAVLSNPSAQYIFAGIYAAFAWWWGRFYAFSYIGAAIAMGGPIAIAVLGGVEPVTLIIIGLGVMAFTISSRHTSSTFAVNDRKARTDTTLEQLDQLFIVQQKAAMRTVNSEYLAACHDMKNALGPIHWNLDYFLGQLGVYTEDSMKAVAEANQCAVRALDTLENLHNTLRARTKEIAAIENFDLPSVVPGPHRLGKEAQPVPGIEIITTIPPPAVQLSGSAENFQMVVRNLIGNAKDAGAKTVKIGTVLVDGGARVVLSLSDDGPGLPEEVREKLFRPFVTSGKPNGTGLGLYLSHKLIETMGGDLKLVSTGEDGTSFDLVLPVAQVESIPRGSGPPS